MNLKDCHNFNDFRKLAKKKLPSPIFHYIDGGSDDETTLNRNTEAFNEYDLIPNVLRGVEDVDLSTTVLGEKIDFQGKEFQPTMKYSLLGTSINYLIVMIFRLCLNRLRNLVRLVEI